MFEIKSRFSERVVYSSETAQDIREAVLEAISRGADLSDANLSDANLSGANLSDANLRYTNLRGANLSGANLRGANLSDADLSGADLSGANLRGADLRGADLSYANLSDANLRGANLRDADLSGADLRDADLSGANLRCADLSYANLSYANLRGANLRGANLSGANLRDFRAAFESILLSAVSEVPALRLAIVEGRIDGRVYEGECACLVGTIAKIKHCDYRAIDGIEPNSSNPAEQWFMNIRPGDTPDKHQIARITLEWLDEFQAKFDRAVKSLTPAG